MRIRIDDVWKGCPFTIDVKEMKEEVWSTNMAIDLSNVRLAGGMIAGDRWPLIEMSTLRAQEVLSIEGTMRIDWLMEMRDHAVRFGRKEFSLFAPGLCATFMVSNSRTFIDEHQTFETLDIRSQGVYHYGSTGIRSLWLEWPYRIACLVGGDESSLCPECRRVLAQNDARCLRMARACVGSTAHAVLADALEDVGATNAAFLEHLRSGVHEGETCPCVQSMIRENDK